MAPKFMHLRYAAPLSLLLACGTQEVSVLSPNDAGVVEPSPDMGTLDQGAPDAGPGPLDMGTPDTGPEQPDTGPVDLGTPDMGPELCDPLDQLSVELIADGQTSQPPRLLGGAPPFGEFALMTVASDGPELGSPPHVAEVRRYRTGGPWISSTRPRLTTSRTS